MRNERLKTSRLEAELNQTQLAEILGYKGKQAVANWENGHSLPTLRVAMILADLFKKDVSYLFGLKVQGFHTKNNSKERI
ncbi:helix-turn-helix transcriptional regulator [Halobacillus litoralis]|uniref:helix-turn-helix transcriptional regulator n=1 Tax=Halobacillus litoralis TaxID=45668 RepID=UPI0013700D16|nr:helix-turn-helix transcriptional regulator [Halobacillus litoralis]MYL37395.1 helix-turn-helix domain-containing protein [Halobacillus litoralis]